MQTNHKGKVEEIIILNSMNNMKSKKIIILNYKILQKKPMSIKVMKMKNKIY